MLTLATLKFRHAGFTLLELLVAITVFAIMSVMAYGGLSNVIDNSKGSEAAIQRLKALQTAVSTISRDITQISNRSIRDEFGNTQGFLQTNHNADLVMEFTRNGRRNPAGLARSSFVRVAYQLKENTLIRLSWPQLDRTSSVEPYESEIIDGVSSIDIRYKPDQGNWQTQWPPLNTNTQAGTAGPTLIAVELTLELEDYGQIKRLFEVTP